MLVTDFQVSNDVVIIFSHAVDYEYGSVRNMVEYEHVEYAHICACESNISRIINREA